MRGSFRFARVFGIDLKIHFTFLIIVLIAAMQGRGSIESMIFGVAFILLVFVCVTLHELGHAVAAMRYGISVREIVLLPIGGVAVMGRMPEKPMQELIIAIAGPAVNVLILLVLVPIWLFSVGGFAGIHELTDRLAQAARLGSPTGMSPTLTMLTLLISANWMLIIFNLIPAFPLDGGRIFRAILAFFMPHVKATRIAATVGQYAAVALAIWGLFSGQILLAVIAFFIFMGAGAESSAAQAGTILATRRVGDAYNKTAIVLTLEHRASHVIEHVLTSYQSDFAVLNRGKLAGIVTRDDVLRWLANTPGTYDVYVTELMQEEPKVVKVEAGISLDEVSKVMLDREVRVVAVFDADHYLGLVSSEDIAEAQAVLTFLNRRTLTGVTTSRSAWPVPLRA